MVPGAKFPGFESFPIVLSIHHPGKRHSELASMIIMIILIQIMIIHDTQVRQGQPTPSMIEKNGDIWSCIVCGKIASDPKTKVGNKVFIYQVEI